MTPPTDEPLPGVGSEAQLRTKGHLQQARLVLLSVVGLLLLFAAAGGIGSGPLSWASADEGDLRVSYERYARAGGPWALEVEAVPPPSGPLRLEISREFHDAHILQSVTPQPATVQVSPDTVTYAFEAVASADRVAVTFRFTGDAIGRHVARVGVADGGPRIEFSQLVYP